MAGHKARYLDEPDAKKMLQLLQNEPIQWRAPIIFDLLSGLRRAELLGLRWQDIDFSTGVVHVFSDFQLCVWQRRVCWHSKIRRFRPLFKKYQGQLFLFSGNIKNGKIK